MKRGTELLPELKKDWTKFTQLQVGNSHYVVFQHLLAIT